MRNVISRDRRARLAIAVAAGAALTLGACGTVSRLTTGHAISESISRIGGQSALSVRFSLGIDASQVEQLSAKGGGSPATPAEAQALATGSIFFSEQTGHGEAIDSSQASSDSANSVDFGLQIGNDIPFEIRYIQRALFVRIDVTQVLTDVGQDTSKAASWSKDLQQANAYIPGLSALAQGDWVEITAADLQSVSGLLKHYASSLGGGTNAANQSQIRSAVTALRKDLVSSIEDNATFQNDGTQNGQTEYGVTVSVQGFLDQFGPALQKDLNMLPGGLGSRAATSLKQAEAKIPANQSVVLHLFVQDNKLNEVDLDLNQFAGKDRMPFAVPLKLNISTPASPIAAPAGATQLDLSKLPQLITGLLGQLGHTSASA